MPAMRRLACGLLVLAGCGALDDFEVSVSDEATIEGKFLNQPEGLSFGGSFGGLRLETTKQFTDQGADPSDVDAIFVKSITVEATNPAGINLAPILSSVSLFVAAPGQPKLAIGTATLDANAQLKSLSLDAMTMTNLKPWAVAGPLTMSADIVLRQKPAFDTTLRTTVLLLVDINLLGT